MADAALRQIEQRGLAGGVLPHPSDDLDRRTRRCSGQGNVRGQTSGDKRAGLTRTRARAPDDDDHASEPIQRAVRHYWTRPIPVTWNRSSGL